MTAVISTLFLETAAKAQFTARVFERIDPFDQETAPRSAVTQEISEKIIEDTERGDSKALECTC